MSQVLPELALPDLVMGETHEVLNQPPPLENYNMFDQDQALIDLMGREDTDWGVDEVRQFGAILGRNVVPLAPGPAPAAASLPLATSTL